MIIYSLERDDGYGDNEHFGLYSTKEIAEKAKKYFEQGDIVEYEVDENVQLFDKKEYTLEIFKDNKLKQSFDNPIKDLGAKETITYGYNQLMQSTEYYLVISGIIATSKEEALSRAISLRQQIEEKKQWPEDAKEVKTKPTSIRDL